ncbi:hypothetical protein LTR17_014637 [Elasticomyces elasticus]|nr:hypothetical protein LTR17_014637 [Elasticomyces elasticus]
MAPITSTSDTGSNDGSETATLMGLPKELRDAIWEFALTEDEPVLPYLERRTIPRPDRKAYQTSIVRQMRRQPPSPPLFHVDKRTRREAYPIYWRSNVFAFTLGSASGETANKEQVDKWQRYVVPTGYRKTYTDFNTRPYMEALWNVRLEFMMHEPDITLQHLREDRLRSYLMSAMNTPEGLLRPATIDVRLVGPGPGHRKLEVVFGGVAAEACTCWVRTEAEFTGAGGSYNESTIAYFATQIERHLKEVWTCDPSGTITQVCQTCGKLEVTPRNSTDWAYHYRKGYPYFPLD